MKKEYLLKASIHRRVVRIIGSLFFASALWCSVSGEGLLTATAYATTWNNESADDELPWPDRHGPTLDGHVPAAHAQALPTEWNEDADKNVAWQVDLEGAGHSTPVIGEGKIWFTAATEDGTKQSLYCVAEDSGEVLIHRVLFENENPEPLGNDINTYASPTCYLEAGAVYVHFGTYGTVRLDADSGDVVWERRDIHCRHFRGPGSSPVVVDDLLILTFDGIDQQFLTALNKETGATIWRTDRSTDYGDLDAEGKPTRDGDLRKAYSTPGVVLVDGRKQVVSVGARAAFGYDAESGKEIWTVRHDDYNAASRPIFYNGLVILNTGGRGANLTAYRLDKSTQGDVTDSHQAWDIPKGNARLATPILVEGRVYMVTDRGVVRCIDAMDGSEVYAGRIDGNFVASPIVANGHLYFCNEDGKTFVVAAGDEFKLVATNELEEGMRASPAAANGAIYLRTFHRLYKIQLD